MEENIQNYIIQKFLDSAAHIDTLTRIERYKLWQNLLKEEKIDSLCRYGFRVYSQNDQDGIIQEIFNRIGITNKVFIEFGCDNGVENNTHFLLIQDWNGLWIDSNVQHIEFIRKNFNFYIENKKLTVINKKLSVENLDSVLSIYLKKYNNECDLLVIDTDWNDYYFWESLTIQPRVVCIEYNGSIRPPVSVVVPYSEEYKWDGSNYFGASLTALCKLGKEKGYTCVGCSIAGTDAFFVRNDLNYKFISFNNDPIYSSIYHFQPARYNLEFNLGHKSNFGDWEIIF